MDKESSQLEAAESDDEKITLRPETIAVLNEFLAEKKQKETFGTFEEDWQLSQFWYTEETCKTLVNECISALIGNMANVTKVACISCPSLLPYFKETQECDKGKIIVKLFEIDCRFQTLHPDSFVSYDYKSPLNLSNEYLHYFDYIIADPPFLSDECFVKVAQTVQMLAKPNALKLFNTGTVMADLLERLLKLKKTRFRPMHRNNLANEFTSFTNYDPATF